MLPTAHIEHQLPQRTRLKIPSKRGDAAFFATVANRLAKAPGVQSVSASPYASSLLVRHTDDFGAISSSAQQNGIFQIVPHANSNSEHSSAQSSVELASPLDAVAVGFFGMSLYQITQGRYFGTAVENIWNAYGAHTALNQPFLAAALLGIGLYQLTEGQVLGPAVSLFFYAATARHLARTHQPEAVA